MGYGITQTQPDFNLTNPSTFVPGLIGLNQVRTSRVGYNEFGKYCSSWCILDYVGYIWIIDRGFCQIITVSLVYPQVDSGLVNRYNIKLKLSRVGKNMGRTRVWLI